MTYKLIAELNQIERDLSFCYETDAPQQLVAELEWMRGEKIKDLIYRQLVEFKT